MSWRFCKPQRSSLTRRELDVLYLASHGSGAKEGAWTLGISVKTYERHLSNLMQKLDLHSKYECVVYAARTGLHRELRYELRTSTHVPVVVRPSLNHPSASQTLTVVVPSRKAMLVQ